LERGRKKDR
jgi:hypothetical protein